MSRGRPVTSLGVEVTVWGPGGRGDRCGLGVRPRHLRGVTAALCSRPRHAARAPGCVLTSWPSAAPGAPAPSSGSLWGCSCWAQHVLSTEAPSWSCSSWDPSPCQLTGSLSVPTEGYPSCFPPGQVSAAALARTPLSAGGSHPIPAPQPEALGSLLAPLRPSQAPRGLLTRPVSSSCLPSCRAWPGAETRNVPTLSKEGSPSCCPAHLILGPGGGRSGNALPGTRDPGGTAGSVPSAPPPWVRRRDLCAQLLRSRRPPALAPSPRAPPLRNSRHGCLRPLPTARHFDLSFPPFTVPVTGQRVSKFCKRGGKVVG